MAEERTIPLVLDVRGVKAIKTIGELKKGITDTRAELEKTKVGTKRFDELSEAVKKAEGRVSDLNKKATAFKDFPGPIGALAKTFGDVQMAVGRAITAFTTLRGVLIATGIGALVAAFGLLMTYFRSTEEGAQRLRVIMAVVNGVADQLKDVAIAMGKSLFEAFSNPKQALKDFGNLIKDNIVNRIEGMMELFPALSKAIKLALKGEFSAAGEVATNAVAKVTLGVEDFTDKVAGAVNTVTDFAKATAQAATEAGNLEAAMNAVKVRERELKVERAEANKTIAEQRNLAKDLTLSLEDRINALTRANELEVSLMNRELDNEQERLRIMQAQAALAESDETTINAIADQRIRVAQIEEQSLNKRRELQEQLTTLRRMEEAEEKRLADEKAQRDAEALQKETEYQEQLREARAQVIADEEARELELATVKFEQRLARIAEEFGAETELYKLLEEERGMALAEIRAKWDEKRADTQKKQREDELNAERKFAEARLSVANSVASGLSSIASMIQGESEGAVAARKILALAQVAIDTATAISAGVAGATTAASATGPGAFVATPVFIASTIATVLGAIGQATAILSSVPGGGGGPNIPSSAPSVSAPSIPPVSTNTFQTGDTTQSELAPVQAYVVETEITGSQNNINQIESQANFG
jgi:hypothetical protein